MNLVPRLKGDLPVDEIRLADKAGDQRRAGMAVDLLWCSDLGDVATIEDGEAVGDGESLLLIVSHIDSRKPEFFADTADLGAHLDAKLGIEIRERFIQHEAAWAHHEGAGKRDTLLLPAGELIDFAIAETVHLDHGEGLLDAFLDLSLLDAPFFKAEGDILEDIEMGPEGVALEHHGCLPLVRRDLADVITVEQDFALFRKMKTGNGTEQSGLTAAAGPEQEKEFTGSDVDIELVQRNNAAEAFDESTNLNGYHERDEAPLDLIKS